MRSTACVCPAVRLRARSAGGDPAHFSIRQTVADYRHRSEEIGNARRLTSREKLTNVARHAGRIRKGCESAAKRERHVASVRSRHSADRWLDCAAADTPHLLVELKGIPERLHDRLKEKPSFGG